MSESRRLERIAQLTSAAQTTEPLDAQIGGLCRTTAEALGVDACVIRELRGSSLVLRAQVGLPQENAVDELPSNYGVGQKIIEERSSLRVDDVLTHPLTKNHLKSYGGLHFCSYAGAPMISSGDVAGVIGVYTLHEHRIFSDEDLQHLQIIANHIAVLIRNERLLRAVEEEKRALDRRVAERTDELHQANRQLEQFSYAVAHDLRAPLRAVVSTSRFLQLDYGHLLPAEGVALLKRQEKVANEMAAMIDGLLRLSAVSRAEPQMQLVQPSSLASAVVDDYTLAHPRHGIKFVISETTPVLADPALLRTAIQNLMENAAKFSKGRVEPLVRFGETEPGLIFVSDNGIGFDEADAEQLFQPFTRLGDAKEVEGIGMGLATVKRIVEMHGGTISAQAAPGVGATFTIRLAPFN